MSIALNSEVKKIIEDIRNVCGMLWNKGWIESSGGNFSVRLTDIISSDLIFFEQDTYSLNEPIKELADETLLITGTGERIRDIAQNPLMHCAILKINQNGDGYYVLRWDNEDKEFIPTSEFASHLLLHKYLIENDYESRVVLHAHPVELVAMTLLEKFRNIANLNDQLKRLHTEFLYFFPKGIGYVPFAVPGSLELAKLTLEQLHKYDVVAWGGHGCLSVARDINSALDKLDAVNKVAEIYLKIRNNTDSLIGMNDKEIDQLIEAYENVLG